jgi:hypothetical protein
MGRKRRGSGKTAGAMPSKSEGANLTAIESNVAPLPCAVGESADEQKDADGEGQRVGDMARALIPLANSSVMGRMGNVRRAEQRLAEELRMSEAAVSQLAKYLGLLLLTHRHQLLDEGINVLVIQ